MKKNKHIKKRRLQRIKRVRSKILKITKGGVRPRLSVFRSNKRFYAQIIDDSRGHTLVSVHEEELGKVDGLTKTDTSRKLGELIASRAKKLKIDRVVFDKGRYKYHGIIKAFADGAREGGLKF